MRPVDAGAVRQCHLVTLRSAILNIRGPRQALFRLSTVAIHPRGSPEQYSTQSGQNPSLSMSSKNETRPKVLLLGAIEQ